MMPFLTVLNSYATSFTTSDIYIVDGAHLGEGVHSLDAPKKLVLESLSRHIPSQPAYDPI